MSSKSRELATALVEVRSGKNDTLQRLMSELKRPTVGAAIAGAEVVGTAIVFGVAETLVAATAAYVVFRCVEEQFRASR